MTTTMPMRPTLLRQTPASITFDEMVASNVRAQLAIARFRATHLASIIGVSYGTALRRWHGRGSFKTRELWLIANACGIPVSDLVKEAE